MVDWSFEDADVGVLRREDGIGFVTDWIATIGATMPVAGLNAKSE